MSSSEANATSENITRPADMDLARLFLSFETPGRESKLNSGPGSVGTITALRPATLVIGGIRIESEFGLDGHSDADVLLHAITDAILGAAALGDIGMHFPDSDPRWKAWDRVQFLQHALQMAMDRGYQVVNIDSTVILEEPPSSGGLG